jgi:hypothetical protein
MVEKDLKLKGGVLIIGSLYWQDYRDNPTDNIRINWRKAQLDMQNATNVSVPIKYGRFSGKIEDGVQTYTMVFDNTLEPSQYGSAKAVPFKNQPQIWVELENEVIELSKAEGKEKKFLKGNYAWGVCCIVFNPNLREEIKEYILLEWEKGLKEYTTSYKVFENDYDGLSVSKKGELLIEWPNEAMDFDYLIATSTRPKFRDDNCPITPKEIADYVNNRPYFFENIKAGIKTYQDEEIAKEYKSLKQ